MTPLRLAVLNWILGSVGVILSTIVKGVKRKLRNSIERIEELYRWTRLTLDAMGEKRNVSCEAACPAAARPSRGLDTADTYLDLPDSGDQEVRSRYSAGKSFRCDKYS